LDTFILGDHLYFFDLADCQNLFGAKCYADPAAFAAICMDLQTYNRDLLLSFDKFDTGLIFLSNRYQEILL